MDTPSSRRRSSAAGDLVLRSAVRGVNPAAAKRPRRRAARSLDDRQNVARRPTLGTVVDADIHLSTSCLLARDALLHSRARLVPATGAIHNLHNRKHDRNLDQDADHSR